MVASENPSLQEKISNNIEKIKKIEESLSYIEGIFPNEMNIAYTKYPKLRAILTLVRTWKNGITDQDVAIMNGALLTLQQSESIESVRKELLLASKEIYQVIFPETWTEKLVKFYTEQSKLDWYQQILIAPAKWIERWVWWLISFLNPKTYDELKAATRYMSGISFAEMCKILELMQLQFTKLEKTQQASLGIEFIVSALTLYGVVGSIWQVLWKFKNLAKIFGWTGVTSHNMQQFSKLIAMEKASI
jgi:hypothetical protein